MFRRLIKSHALRRRTSWIVALVLVPPFIFFFHLFTGGSPSPGPGGAAGTIFSRPVSWETFQHHHRWLRRQWESRFGEVPEALEQVAISATWNRLLLLAEAKRRHLRVTDRELATFIHTLPVFQESGRFSPERYAQVLGAIGTNPQSFEDLVRGDLLIERLTASIKEEVSVTDEDLEAAYVKAHERLQASLFLIEPAAFMDQAKAALTDEQVRTHYEAHPEDVRVPERLTIEYAGASRDELLEGVERSDEDLTRQLNALALDLHEDLEAQVPFEELVTTRALSRHTIGPLSAEQLEGITGPAAEVFQAVQQQRLTEDALSDVIETARGVYVARLVQRTPAHVPPFEEVRESLHEQLLQARAWLAARTRAYVLREQLREQLATGRTLEDVAAQLELKPLQPEPFTRTDPIEPLGQVSAVNEAAFSVPAGALSEPVDTPKGFVVSYARERLPPDMSGFAEEKDTRRDQVLREKQNAHFREWLTALGARAKLESFLDAAASGARGDGS